MKILVAFAVILLISAQVFAAEIGLNEDIDWPYSDQIQEELQGPVFESLLQRIARKPRPDQFYGLMGKRNNGFGQISRKRYKSDSFFGLMGKRSLYSGSSERNTLQNYERRR
ncbi:tachykinin-like peptide isoform X2 [Spea bombifrons]|uniref:tachykinin-like peptide isoform X2 n=1 Tax=Spea bombifrons TaxID=233779 RepID=UPI00234A2FDB|nr:tachykinin-like peptide isoform X2 [Spea bombifrons]